MMIGFTHNIIIKFLTLVLSTGEQITLENVLLLTDHDLKELGFAMGHRRVLLSWITQQQAPKDGGVDMTSAQSCSPSPSAASAASPVSR